MIVYEHPLGEVRLNNGAALLVLTDGTEIDLSEAEEEAWYAKLRADDASGSAEAAAWTDNAPADDLSAAALLAELFAVGAGYFPDESGVEVHDRFVRCADAAQKMLAHLAARGYILAPAATAAEADRIKADLARARAAPEAPLVRIGIAIEGGLIQSIFSDQPLPGVEVVVIDYDVEGTQGDEMEEVKQYDLLTGLPSDEWAYAVVSRNDVAVAKIDWEADFRPGDEFEEA